MNGYKTNDISELVKGNSYVGRGIVIGKSSDAKKACFAYFIMGRSNNSRNRIFEEKDGAVFTKPFDETKVEDPSLIIYAAVRKYQNKIIVTNGDQTDTIRDAILSGGTFETALDTREFEPDGPNWTPRISGIIYSADGNFRYKMSILKSLDEEGSECVRETFSYPSKAGLGHFIHTYVTDGEPIPTFVGEPERIEIPDCIDCFTNEIWDNLDENNKISLYVRMTDLTTGEIEERLINKHTL